MSFRRFFFLSRLLLFDFLYLLSSDESYFLGDDSNNYGSESGSSITYSFPNFPLRFDYSVGCVNGLGSGIFVPMGVEFKWDIFLFVVFVPIGVKSKVG